jgi:hypothetical protein
MKPGVILHIKIITGLIVFAALIYLAWNYSTVIIPNFWGQVVKVVVITFSVVFEMNGLSLLLALHAIKD